MQRIPVTRDGKRGSEVLLIDSADVVKIDLYRDREYLIHTKTKQYYLDTSFDSLEEWLFEDGFRMLDSTNIVNMNHVKEYDSRKGVVYLGESNSSKEIKTASAARIQKEHIDKVLRMLKISNEHNHEGPSDFDPVAHINSIISESQDTQFMRSYATIQAVAAKKKAEERILHMAYHDSLTDLPNRLLFQKKLNQFFKEADQSDRMLAVVFIDLDRFKIINDTLGHYVGDELLKYVAAKLSSYVTSNDVVCRFSGDEFIILLSNFVHIDEVKNFAKGLSDLFSEPFIYLEQELYISSSTGISIYPHDGTDADTLIKNADTAMYRAKEKGGNTFQLYYQEMNHRSLEQLNLENQLRKALDKSEITVFYQPLVDLKTGSITGMESLVRWKHPQGMISPGDFIPLAEETGLILPIGNWVLRESCIQNKKWEEQGLPLLTVSVNISVNQFHQPGFVKYVQQTLSETGLDPHRLCLEITENVAMKNVSYIMDTLSKLKEMGVQVSIDDFGTGYSSLNYLKRFDVDTLKIDQSFIRELTTDEDNEAIVTALIAMSKQLKIKTLAEGVETREQLEFLIAKGCDQIQGYIFSRPIPPEEFALLVTNQQNLFNMN
ncbi:diguanylate cyclase [Paenibacillus swuensis]|uniref:Diguanylate cyclase n=1 Tax=Paenibacillus swuensis TaxID=1178515 RepID=A0A172TMN7_9BACL|nr:EAL domain-containing protein [Paenibacillus swuensis]ANE48335.1 diguanylate cyclase [Paenibacillus swuensis]